MNSAQEVENQSYSIVAVDRLIQATRDSGYKGSASAISELVDNSVQAGAKKIAISITEASSSAEQKEMEVSILDNGCGMDPFTLRQALRFGGSTRFGDRSGLGRYGMGLPNASLSQARRVTVYTWQSTSLAGGSKLSCGRNDDAPAWVYKIGRASCRERGEISVGAGSL